MATTQQQPNVFSTEEAQRFAALIAGFDTGNNSEAEAMGKARLLRRMAIEKSLRIIDALELSEVKEAIDDQMQPARQPVADADGLQTEVEELRAKLAVVVPKLRETAEALTNERLAWIGGAFGVLILLGILLVIYLIWGILGIIILFAILCLIGFFIAKEEGGL